jgi:hypothetical protein
VFEGVTASVEVVDIARVGLWVAVTIGDNIPEPKEHPEIMLIAE